MEQDKRFACGNLSERKYKSKVFILTELVNRSECRREDSVLFRDLPHGFSYEIAKSATLSLLLTLTVEL